MAGWLKAMFGALRCLRTALVPMSIAGPSARCISSLRNSQSLQSSRWPALIHRVNEQSPLLAATSTVIAPCCGYKVASALRKRCPHCYFVKKDGRLFIECNVKPRHKQMQKMSKKKLLRDE